jgi:hypothetical protein
MIVSKIFIGQTWTHLFLNYSRGRIDPIKKSRLLISHKEPAQTLLQLLQTIQILLQTVRLEILVWLLKL